MASASKPPARLQPQPWSQQRKQYSLAIAHCFSLIEKMPGIEIVVQALISGDGGYPEQNERIASLVCADFEDCSCLDSPTLFGNILTRIVTSGYIYPFVCHWLLSAMTSSSETTDQSAVAVRSLFKDWKLAPQNPLTYLAVVRPPFSLNRYCYSLFDELLAFSLCHVSFVRFSLPKKFRLVSIPAFCHGLTVRGSSSSQDFF